jgi:diadenosine tetraphosphatase ApaH/serine/threonine PP2A family protein phosphatase
VSPQQAGRVINPHHTDLGCTNKRAAGSAMDGSCPVCYENYDIQGPNVPRRLACSHVVCEQCVQTEIYDGSYYCPECAFKHDGTMDDFSHVATADDVATPVADDLSDSEEVGTASTDALMADSLHPVRSPRAICSVPSCKNKAMSVNGLCLKHSKKRHKSMTTADIVAQNISNTSFYSITSSSGNIFANSMNPAGKLPMSPEAIMERFKDQKRLELGEAMELIDVAKGILVREPNILNIDAPVVTVGDVHGQYYDLINLFVEGGKPGEVEQYLFLGDYVDRGNFSCEVIFLLVALKVKYPSKVWLLRGNHECASVSGHFGFKEECKKKYGVNVYYNILLLFQTMPLAAVISTAYGDIFACHGGLSPSLATLDDISKLNRLVEPEADTALLDLLWSDPVSEENADDFTDEEYEDYMNIEWKSNPARGCSYAFGYKAVRAFLDANNLVCVVRAHEVQELGFKKHFEPEVMERRIKTLLRKRINSQPNVGVNPTDLCRISVGKEKDIPPLITIFSAPNYCDRYQNMGAILRIESGLDGFRVIQYPCVWHPEPETAESQTDNYILAITSACPYMPTSFRHFVRRAVELGYEEETNLVDAQDENADEVAPASEGCATPKDAEHAVGSVTDSDDNSTTIATQLSMSSSSESPTKSSELSGLLAITSPRGSVTDTGTPKHEDFNVNDNADIIRHLKAFPVRRSSTRTGAGNKLPHSRRTLLILCL